MSHQATRDDPVYSEWSVCPPKPAGAGLFTDVHVVLGEAPHPCIDAVNRGVGTPQLCHHLGVSGDGVKVTGTWDMGRQKEG